MRVLFYSHQSHYVYGGEVVTLALARELSKRGEEVFFAAPPGPYLEKFRGLLGEAVFTVSSLEFRRSFAVIFRLIAALPSTLIHLQKIVHENRIEILHANTLKAIVYVWPLGFFFGLKVIWHHHDILPTRGLNQVWLRLLARGARKIIVPSHAAKQALISAGIAPAKVEAIWNGFDPSEWSSPEGVRPARSFQIFFVGELSLRKGADLLPEIASRLAALAKKEFQIIVIGAALSEPELAISLKQRVKNEGLESYFQFMGRREDVKGLLREADVLILPSRQDPFPTVVLEAAFSGVPIIASPVGGVPEMFRNGEGGRFAGNAEDFARELAEWVDDPIRARREGALARQFAESNFSLGQMADQVKAIYKNC
jgi:glycosyltransferase involved in cell wall biosynthesis